MESDNRELARKAENWVEHQDDYDVIFRIVSVLLAAAMTVMLAEHCRDLSLMGGRVLPLIGICMGIVLGCVAFAEVLVRMINYRFYMIILRLSMPVIQSYNFV